MNLTIYHIKPDWLRRVILVVAFIPLAAVWSVLGMAQAANDAVNELFDIAMDCWHAKD